MKNTMMMLALMIFMVGILSAQNGPEPADKVLKDACRQAATENKNVMIVFHASC